MFLVPTRSPHRVEHFASCPDEFRRFDFRISKREVIEEKKLKKKYFSYAPSLSLSRLPFSFSYICLFVLFFIFLF